MNFKRIALATAFGALTLSLAACGGGREEEQSAAPTNVDNLAEEDASNLTEALPAEAPPATRVDNAATEALPVQETLTADEQTQADADATGMTARVVRDEGGNEATPAQ